MASDSGIDGLARDAVVAGDVARLPPLLAAGADPNRSDVMNAPLLRLAAENHDLEVMRALLDAGAHPDGQWAAHGFASSPLACCVDSESGACAVLLLSRGACPDGAAKRAGDAAARPVPLPACVAAARRRPEALRMLGQAGADMNLLNDAGRTPLICAIEARCVESVRACLAFGADPDLVIHGDVTPAKRALRSSVECMMALCEFGFDPDAVDFQGKALAELAREEPWREAVPAALAWIHARGEKAQVEAAAKAGGARSPGKRI